jgi:hypothetical protein
MKIDEKENRMKKNYGLEAKPCDNGSVWLPYGTSGVNFKQGCGAGAETFGRSRSRSWSRYTEVSAPAPGSGSRAN